MATEHGQIARRTIRLPTLPTPRTIRPSNDTRTLYRLPRKNESHPPLARHIPEPAQDDGRNHESGNSGQRTPTLQQLDTNTNPIHGCRRRPTTWGFWDNTLHQCVQRWSTQQSTGRVTQLHTRPKVKGLPDSAITIRMAG